MGEELTREDQFLLKEYESASHLTYHIDELRNKLTSFFLILTGLGVGGLTLIIKGEAKNLFEPQRLVASLLIINGVVGVLVIGILARLRRVQLEHFRIINNVRKHFLRANEGLWAVVELSEATLPLPSRLSRTENRMSGSYLWVLVIIITNAGVLICAFYILTIKTYAIVSLMTGRVCSVVLGLALVLLQDQIYFLLAIPPKPVAPPKDLSESAS